MTSAQMRSTAKWWALTAASAFPAARRFLESFGANAAWVFGVLAGVAGWALLVARFQRADGSDDRRTFQRALERGVWIQLPLVWFAAVIANGLPLAILYVPALFIGVTVVHGVGEFLPTTEPLSSMVTFVGIALLSLSCGACHVLLSLFLGFFFAPLERTSRMRPRATPRMPEFDPPQRFEEA
jgi:hypothetical protein